MPLQQPRKPLVNILSDWALFHQHGDMRVRGKVQVDQPTAGAYRGAYIITSPLVDIYKERGIRYLETKNSRYILSEED